MSSPVPIRNEKGQVIGYKQGDTYLRTTGQVAAYVKGGQTYTKEGKVIGKGDQAMRLF